MAGYTSIDGTSLQEVVLDIIWGYDPYNKNLKF